MLRIRQGFAPRVSRFCSTRFGALATAVLVWAGCLTTLVEPARAQPAGYDRATLTALRWDPSTPNRVYAGTVGWGLVVSEDGGRTWSATAPQLGGRSIQSIAVHPLLTDVVVVGTRYQGVWQSTDGGRSFERIQADLPEVDVPGVSLAVEIDLEVDEERRRNFEARMRFAGREPDPSQLTSGAERRLWTLLRFRGPVGGRHSEKRNPILVRMQPFHDLTAHPVLADDVLVAGRGVVARSRDGGETWNRVFNPAEFQRSPHLLRGVDPASCFSVPLRFYRVTAHPETIWLAACYGLFVSGDGGETWKISPLSGFGRVHEVAADPTNPAYLAVSTDAGILRSADGGSNWEYVRAATPGSPFGALTILPGGELLAGGYGGEIVRADVDGNVEVGRLRELQATQRNPKTEAERRARRSTAPYDRAGLAARPEANPRLGPGLDLHVADLVVHPNFPNVVFAGTRRGVFRSDDGGLNWYRSSLGLGEMEVSDLEVDASAALVESTDPDPAGERLMLWAATRGGGIYRSTSTGRAWQPVALPGDGVVRVLRQHERDPYTLWAGTADGGVYRSVDTGVSWQAASEGLDEYGIRALVQSEGILLAGTDNGEIYASYDDGGRWEKRGSLSRPAADEALDLNTFRRVGLDPQALHIYDLLADPDDSNWIVAASAFGVFLSHDGGASWTWTKLRRGVQRLARDPYDEDTIFAATTRGLWWTEDGGETWEQAEFGKALNELSLEGGDLDPTQALVETPPLFGLTPISGGDVLAGTDRGQVVRGSAEFGGWKVAHLAEPSWIARPKGGEAPREPSDRQPPDRDPPDRGEMDAERDDYERYRERRDQLLVDAALAPGEIRRMSRPRSRVLLALEARRRGEIPDYPSEIYDALPFEMRAEVDKEDVATRVLRLADGDLRTLETRLIDGWGVDRVLFGPLGQVLAVQSSVDDGRRTQTELRLYDLSRRYLQPDKVFRRQGSTQYWKVLHDLGRKPQAAQPDWLLEDTGPLLLWRRGEILVTRPRDDRIAIWRLSRRGLEPARATPVQPGTVRGFPLPVASVSLSEDGKWLGAIDIAGRALYASMTGGREPQLLELPEVFDQVHATSKQLLLLGPSGIVAYRWGPKGPILETPDGQDAGQRLLGTSAGFSAVVADRQGLWMAALPATSDEAAEMLVVIAFRDGLAAAVHRLDSGSEEAWTATVSAQQDWLAVRRTSEAYSESLLYGMRGNLVEAGPSLVFRVRDAADLRFGAGGEHVTFTADGETQVWSLRGPAPRRVVTEPPDLHALAQEFRDADPITLAAFFFAGEPRMADHDEWMPYEKHGADTTTSPDGRWLAVSGPGRLVRLWHFDDPTGNLAAATGSVILDLARFRPYPSTFPSSLDAWPEIKARTGEPAGAELWRDACSLVGRNLSPEEWDYLFGEENWAPSCSFE